MPAARRRFLTLSLLLAAVFCAAPPARAQREERREERGEARRMKPRAAPRKPGKRPPVGKPRRGPAPRRGPVPHPRPRARPLPRVPPRGQVPPRAQAPARAPLTEWMSGRDGAPAETARREAPARARFRRLRKPEPIKDDKDFVRHWAPPPAPKTNASGGLLTAKPAEHAPPPQHAAVFNNAAVVTTIISNQQNEASPNRYYWHHDGGWDYVHCYRGGEHWYGFYAGPNYYWSRYHAGRWWWYDPAGRRYLYFHGGYWWWQDPSSPSALFVYQSGSYVPYAVAAQDASADESAAPQQPGTPGAPNVVAYTAPAGPPAPLYHSDVDEPNYSARQDPNRFALVIGVEEYAGLPAADFAARDAAAVRAHLAALGYPDRNVVLLVSSQAARGSVAKYVESWLPERVTARSRVFVYFSGHGAPDPKTGEAYLMPWDGDPKYLNDTGYPVKRLYAELNALPAKEIVVVLDSCFSGAGGRSVLVAGARPLVTNVDAGRGAAGKAVVFSATGNDEITGTLPAQGHGLFTYWFLKGLNGGAAGGDDGVTVQSLFDYLAPNVEDAARRENRDQTPQLFVPPDGQRRLLIKDLR